MLTKNKKTMKFGILLGTALLLFVVGFLLSAFCISEANSVKPVVASITCLFAGVIFRELHYTKDQRAFAPFNTISN